MIVWYVVRGNEGDKVVHAVHTGYTEGWNEILQSIQLILPSLQRIGTVLVDTLGVKRDETLFVLISKKISKNKDLLMLVKSDDTFKLIPPDSEDFKNLRCNMNMGVPQGELPTCWLNSVISAMLLSPQTRHLIKCKFQEYKKLPKQVVSNNITDNPEGSCPIQNRDNFWGAIQAVLDQPQKELDAINNTFMKDLRNTMEISTQKILSSLDLRERPMFLIPGWIPLPAFRKICNFSNISYCEMTYNEKMQYDWGKSPKPIGSHDLLVLKPSLLYFHINSSLKRSITVGEQNYVLSHAVLYYSFHYTSAFFDKCGNGYVYDPSYNSLTEWDWTRPQTDEETNYDKHLYFHEMSNKGRHTKISFAYIVYIRTSAIECTSIGGRPKKVVLSQRSKWLPTNFKVMHKGKVRKVWCNADDTTLHAIKRLVKSVDGTRKYRYEKIR